MAIRPNKNARRYLAGSALRDIEVTPPASIAPVQIAHLINPDRLRGQWRAETAAPVTAQRVVAPPVEVRVQLPVDLRKKHGLSRRQVAQLMCSPKWKAVQSPEKVLLYLNLAEGNITEHELGQKLGYNSTATAEWLREVETTILRFAAENKLSQETPGDGLEVEGVITLLEEFIAAGNFTIRGKPN